MLWPLEGYNQLAVEVGRVMNKPVLTSSTRTLRGWIQPEATSQRKPLMCPQRQPPGQRAWWRTVENVYMKIPNSYMCIYSCMHTHALLHTVMLCIYFCSFLFIIEWCLNECYFSVQMDQFNLLTITWYSSMFLFHNLFNQHPIALYFFLYCLERQDFLEFFYYT